MKRRKIVFVLLVFGVVALGFYRERARRTESGTSSEFSESARPDFEVLELPIGSFTLAGTVETSDGLPAEGIDVVLFRSEPLAREAEPVNWATTDAEGRFAFDELKETEYTALLHRQGIRPRSFRIRVPAGEDVFPWRLHEPLPALESLPEIVRADLRGKVVVPPSYSDVANLAIEGYELVLRPVEATHPLSGAVKRRALTDAAGNFVFEKLVTADYVLELLPPWAKSGSWPVLDRLELSHRTDVVAPPTLRVQTARVVGHVADLEARSIEGALVRIWPKGAPERTWPPTQTDARGDFSLFDLPAGAYRIRIRAGAAVHEETVEVQEGVTTRLTIARLDPRTPPALPSD